MGGLWLDERSCFLGGGPDRPVCPGIDGLLGRWRKPVRDHADTHQDDATPVHQYVYAHGDAAADRNPDSVADAYGHAAEYIRGYGAENAVGEYLRLIEGARKAVTIPVIASRNGMSPGGWTKYAKTIEEAGADALELNVYALTTDPKADSLSIEERASELQRKQAEKRARCRSRQGPEIE